jgi:hypothetical protein
MLWIVPDSTENHAASIFKVEELSKGDKMWYGYKVKKYLIASLKLC